MAAITREQLNILTAIGVALKEARQGPKKARDQMEVYIAKKYGTPTDDELKAAGFDYTATDILAAVDSAGEIEKFFGNQAATVAEHGAIFDKVRIG